jgi:hypothetical protein
MPKTIARLAFAAALTIAAVAPLQGQGLSAGTWTGSITPPGGEAIPVSFEVGGTAAAPTVAMSAPMVQGTIAFNDIRVEGPMLLFWWEPGVRVDCQLTRTAAGGYEGPCSDGSGGASGALSMVPPGTN